MDKRARGYLAAAAATAVVGRALYRHFTKLDLQDKVVVVTGGSRGLGLVLARQLVAARAKVVICARDLHELGRAHEDLIARGGNVLAVSCDVTDRVDVANLVQRVNDVYGPIDVLVNNAGVIQTGPVELMTIADYEEAMHTHFWGPLYLTLAIAPQMIERRSGRIVNIASIGGKIAVPHLLPYTASKFALVGLSEGLRAELGKHGVCVTTVVPGLMRTGSPRNATFKGQHRAEYAWFAIPDSLPLVSVAAERAARRIVSALRHGDPEVVLGIPAQVATRVHGVAPGLVQRALGLVDRILPKPGGIGPARAKGWESESSLAPSILTRLTDRAAARNNEN